MDQKRVEQVDEIKGKSPDLQENQSYPVEVKSHEQSQNSIEEDIDSTIKISVRIGFIRKVYGILSFQLLLTFGSVMLSQLKPVKYYINHNQIFSTNLLIISSVLFIIFFLILACCKGISRRVPYNYLFLFGITLSQAISCSIAASIYSFKIVSTALLLTIVATLAITFYACTTKNNFAICRIGLYVILASQFCSEFMRCILFILFV